MQFALAVSEMDAQISRIFFSFLTSYVVKIVLIPYFGNRGKFDRKSVDVELSRILARKRLLKVTKFV